MSTNRLLALHTVPTTTPIWPLNCQAFDKLTAREKAYVHHLSQAAWQGSLAVLLQLSAESPVLFLLLLRIFQTETPEQLRESATATQGVSDVEYQEFLVYACSVFSNMGNFLSFGDTKIIPALPPNKFHAIVKASHAYRDTAQQPSLQELWNHCKVALYSLAPNEQQLGFGPDCLTTYYSANCVRADAEFIQGFMDEKKISPYNTRLFKLPDANGRKVYKVVLASAETSNASVSSYDRVAPLLGTFSYKDAEVQVCRGDYSAIMQRTVNHLQKAKECASNETEVRMIEKYIDSFRYGSIEDHKDGSRHWIKDKGPIVETYIGFIESYRDPLGVRGEFEGFVAVVNKELSLKLGRLVDSAEKLLPLLPWPQSFEKDKFLRPDFTSLDIIAFSGSGLPAGINIPNYDDIRQKEGFKNVSLGNVLSARYSSQDPITFISDEDQQLYKRLQEPAFEVQVALHELLGHGSGKMLHQEADGTRNYDEGLVNPLTNGPITKCYRPGETYDTVFASLSSSYEECRAEAVGIYLSLFTEVLNTLGYEDAQAIDDVSYVNWLIMVRAGLCGLEYYSPETKSWRQAHMQARYVILQVLLEAGEGLVTIDVSPAAAADSGNCTVRLDRSKMRSVGKRAIEQFLQKLQVFKATADIKSAEDLYGKYSAVNEHFLRLRGIVLDKKKPRGIFLMPNTVLSAADDNDGGEARVTLEEYPVSFAGIIQSYTNRFGRDLAFLHDAWKRDQPFVCR